MLLNLVIYISAFVLLWVGVGLIVKTVEKIAKRLKMSPFGISFLFLGLITTIPELSLGLNAIAEEQPEIFVGNLLGGIPVLFLFLIPLLAILGKGIKLDHNINNKMLLFMIALLIMPSLTIIDKRVTSIEGLIIIVMYFLLIFYIEEKDGFFKNHNFDLKNHKTDIFDYLKVFIGLPLIFLSTKVIVTQTDYFSDLFNIPQFYVALFFLSLGTNIPEITIAIRSIMSGSKDVAFGNYLGSAAANPMLFGVLTIINGGEVLTGNNYLSTSIFIVIGLTLFYIFAKSKFEISRKEGYVLLSVYLIFILFEFLN